MRMKIIIILLILLFLLLAHSLIVRYPKFALPNIAVADSKVSIEGFTNSSLSIILKVENPNNIPVVLTKIKYIVYGDDNASICKGNITKQIIIRPNTVKYIPIRVRMRYATLKAVWGAMAMDKIEWRVVGQIYLRVNNKDIMVSFIG